MMPQRRERQVGNVMVVLSTRIALNKYHKDHATDAKSAGSDDKAQRSKHPTRMGSDDATDAESTGWVVV
jgi:hypothetical protein